MPVQNSSYSLRSKFKKIFLFFKQNWIISGITLAGAVLRLYNLRSTISFLGDQGRDALIVRHIITDLNPVLIGPTTSVGKIQLGPLYYYFMAPWLAVFNFDPIGPALGVALLGIVTIPVLFFVVRRMFGAPEAYIAAILYTFSDVVIRNTRFSWNPNPMPLVIILLIWSLYEAYKQKRYSFLILSWILWGIALQLHYMALLLAPFLCTVWFLIAVQEKKQRLLALKYWSIGLGAFLLLAMPLIVFDLRHDYLNARGFLEFFQKGHHSPHVWYQPLKDMEGRLYQGIGQILGFEPWWQVRNILSVILAASWLSLFIKNIKEKSWQITGILFITGWVALSLYSGDIFEHYLGFYYPVPFLLAATILGFLWKHNRYLLRSIVIALVLGIVAYNVSIYQFYKPLGWQLDDIEQVSKVIAEDAGQKLYNVVLLDDTKDYRAMNYRYFLDKNGSKPADIMDYESVNALYVLTNKPLNETEDLGVWEIETFTGKDINETDRRDVAEKLIMKSSAIWYFPGGPWVYKLDKEKMLNL